MKLTFIMLALLTGFYSAQAQSAGWQNNPHIKELTKQAIQFEDDGDNEKAANAFLTIFNLDPSNYVAANSMAGNLGKMGDFRTEIIWAQKAISLKSDFALAYVNLGNGYAGQEIIPMAEENYKKAAELDPKSPYPAYELGVLEEAKGNIQKAVTYYERSETLDPDFENAWFNLAAGYANLKDYDKAYQYIKRFLLINPDDKDAKEMYAHILMAINMQPFSYPALPKTGKKPEDFVPAGWKIKDKTIGDLNGDKIADAALVLEYHRLTSEIRSNEDTIQSHPRILLILFKNGDHYDLLTQQKTFILREGESSLMDDGDPYDNIEIAKGILNINFQFLRSHLNYKIRYQSNDFYLIGAMEAGVSNNIVYKWDFNFSTRRLIYNEGESTDEKDTAAKNKTELRKINLPQLKKLSELKQPYRWEVMKDVFI